MEVNRSGSAHWPPSGVSYLPAGWHRWTHQRQPQREAGGPALRGPRYTDGAKALLLYLDLFGLICLRTTQLLTWRDGGRRFFFFPTPFHFKYLQYANLLILGRKKWPVSTAKSYTLMLSVSLADNARVCDATALDGRCRKVSSAASLAMNHIYS